MNSQDNYLCCSAPNFKFDLGADEEFITSGCRKGSVVLGKKDHLPRHPSDGARSPPEKGGTPSKQEAPQGHWAKVNLLSGNEVHETKVSLFLLAPVLTLVNNNRRTNYN